MDETQLPAPADPQNPQDSQEPQETTITINDAASGSEIDIKTSGDDQSADQAASLQQSVSNATALGWAMAELLGRCFVLPEARPAAPAWDGATLVALQETFTPRETIRALVQYILFLANSLKLSSFVITRDGDPDNNKLYVDVLVDDVTQFTQLPAGPDADQQSALLRGKINQRLFFWDLKIQDALQNGPTVINKAYIVGRSLAALRWYLGQQHQILDPGFLQNLCQKDIPVLAPYISPFTTASLAYSVENWGTAISAGQVTPGPVDPEGMAPPELKKQADIWFSLLSGERAALSYVDSSVASRPYILRILRFSSPLFIAGIIPLLLVIGLLLYVLFSHLNFVVTAVTTAAASLAALGITHSIVTSLGDILLKALSGDILQKVEAHHVGAVKVPMIDSVWNSTQQQAVNKAIYIPPAPPPTTA